MSLLEGMLPTLPPDGRRAAPFDSTALSSRRASSTMTFLLTYIISSSYFPTVYEPTVFENYVHGMLEYSSANPVASERDEN